MLSGKKIILGITGGIAAYKAVELVREFQKAGAEVRVCMTTSATSFVSSTTLAAISHHTVAVDIFPENESSDQAWTRHIEWGEWADLLVIAPCTANTLAKVAHGICDSMLTATVLAARCPILICPTMDGEMYNAPATKKNISIVKEYGYYVLEPEVGYLASGLTGKGRLPELSVILETCDSIFATHLIHKNRIYGTRLKGKKVLVTAGPTREHFDPVRYISNPSSGKMGLAMAMAAKALGAHVKLIHGPIDIKAGPTDCDEVEAIVSAEDLYQAVKRSYKEFDIIIMAAAVSDWSPTEVLEHKAKKSNQPSFEVQATTDILRWLGSNKKDLQTLIGFAMETENLLENASLKRENKQADWIVANALQSEDSVFGSDKNDVLLVGENEISAFKGDKKQIAVDILEYIFKG